MPTETPEVSTKDLPQELQQILDKEQKFFEKTPHGLAMISALKTEIANSDDPRVNLTNKPLSLLNICASEEVISAAVSMLKEAQQNKNPADAVNKTVEILELNLRLLWRDVIKAYTHKLGYHQVPDQSTFMMLAFLEKLIVTSYVPKDTPVQDSVLQQGAALMAIFTGLKAPK